MPINLGTALSLGSSLIGGLGASNAQSSAASSANAANQTAIAEAKARAEAGYTTNKGTIGQGVQQSQGYLDTAYGDTKAIFDPLVQDGDRARGVYNNAVGLNGEQARTSYVNNLMARPEETAGRDLATRQLQQQYGGKLASGAWGRAMERRGREYASQSMDKDLARIKPVMDTGNQARGQQANAATNYGNNSATNTWRGTNAFVQNEDNFSNNMMNAALSSGASNARNARDQGTSQANAFSGIGNALSGAFSGNSFGGGNNNSTMNRTVSSFFS